MHTWCSQWLQHAQKRLVNRSHWQWAQSWSPVLAPLMAHVPPHRFLVFLTLYHAFICMFACHCLFTFSPSLSSPSRHWIHSSIPLFRRPPMPHFLCVTWLFFSPSPFLSSCGIWPEVWGIREDGDGWGSCKNTREGEERRDCRDMNITFPQTWLSASD